MPTRFELERAIETSALPQTARDIAFALCRRMATGTGEIPAQHQPSLTTLARVTGASRRTISRHIRVLMAAGWLTRISPSAHDARTKHQTTRYTVHIPAAELAGDPGADAGQLAIIVDELAAQTGVMVTFEWAAKIRAELLGRPGIREPAAYLRTAIRSEDNPGRWLPAERYQPPQWPDVRLPELEAS